VILQTGFEYGLIGLYVKHSNDLCFYAYKTHYLYVVPVGHTDTPYFYAQTKTSFQKTGV